ncbi:MAG: ABC transporter substrate-binding protein [Lachnospiraceae bacterium]
MRKRMKRIMTVIAASTLSILLVACGSSQTTQQSTQDNTNNSGVTNTQTSNIVNIGVTDTLKTLNPLLIDGGEVNKYATSLMFLPIVELNDELEFVGMLADSVTTEDNITFTVHIDEAATWSDGTPITAEDVEYTARKLASPIIGNVTMMNYIIEGVSDENFVEEGAESISGIQVVDEKTITFTTKYEMSLITFQNSYLRYLLPLPKHSIESFSESELATAEWFQSPDVVSGPYIVTEYDVDHYISYVANKSYWKGLPNIEVLNIKIVDGSQLYAGLQSGEIDITQHTMSIIPQEDYESVEALETVNVVYGQPVTNQSVFIQTENITDAKVRQALVYAIDREKILTDLLNGNGEVVDGFLSSASPFFDEGMEVIKYDPDKAMALLEEANYDSSKVLRFYLNSGDSTMIHAANIMVAQWAAVGINVEIQTVDFATLMTVAGSLDYDLFAVQYTYPPNDPYIDIQWLLSGEGSWTGYANDAVNTALEEAVLSSDTNVLTTQYGIIDRIVQEDVPMFSAYIISAQGAVSKRLENATPSVYGFFNNVHEWKIAE